MNGNLSNTLSVSKGDALGWVALRVSASGGDHTSLIWPSPVGRHLAQPPPSLLCRLRARGRLGNGPQPWGSGGALVLGVIELRAEMRALARPASDLGEGTSLLGGGKGVRKGGL